MNHNLSPRLRRLISSGAIQRLEKKWWGPRYPCKNDGYQFEKFGFSQTVLAFMAMAGGIVLSCIALMAEKISVNLKQRKNIIYPNNRKAW